MNIVDTRAKLGAVLAPASDTDPLVLSNVVEMIDPPALIVEWGDPWMEPDTACLYTANLTIVCVAGRLVPGDGVAKLEELVDYVLHRLQADGASWPLESVTSPRAYTVSKTAYLGARISLRLRISTT